MPESTDASHDISEMRKELERVSKKMDSVSKKVEEVDAKFERANATQLGTLATALVEEGAASREILLAAAGMTVPDIARALGVTENAVYVRLHRARKRAEANAQAGSKPPKRTASKARARKAK